MEKIRELKIARFIPYFDRWNLHQVLSALSIDSLTAAVIRLMTDSKKALSRLGALSAAAAAVT